MSVIPPEHRHSDILPIGIRTAPGDAGTKSLEGSWIRRPTPTGDLLVQTDIDLCLGPVGVFEFDQFGGGTKTLALAIAQSKGFSIAGGGDTLAAIAKYGITDKVGYISTGGGAFLEFLEGKVLPAVEILEQRAH